MKKAMIVSILLCVFISNVWLLSAKSVTPVDIFITPNPMDKHTTITVNFTQATNVGVNVETAEGIVIKTLYWGPADEQLVLTWNRLSDDGYYVPSGSYVVVVNYQSRYTSTKKTLILK